LARDDLTLICCFSKGNVLAEDTTEFQTVAQDGDIPDGQGRCFPINGTMVGVFLEGGKYFAINDFCPHMGASLSDGHVEEGAVMCPWHAWRFRLSDGAWLDNSKSGICTATYDVRVEDGNIQVCVPPADSKPDPDASSSDSSSSS
jgi:nitrite reductase/ring-hydroxylating ferredoxin subunit